MDELNPGQPARQNIDDLLASTGWHVQNCKAFDPASILENKRDHRRARAVRPLGEKLRLLDTLRERELAIRGSQSRSPETSHMLREKSFVYPPER